MQSLSQFNQDPQPKKAEKENECLHNADKSGVSNPKTLDFWSMNIGDCH